MQLKFLLEQIRFIELQVSDIEIEMAKILDKLDSPITTIPCISSVSGATILGEIGDIDRFSNPSKLVAFSDIDASVSQSGNNMGVGYKMSKRDSPYLRKALFQATLVASTHDPTFITFTERNELNTSII